MPKTVYRCKEGMVCGANGRRYHFAAGDLVFEGHPVNPKGNIFFEEVSEYVERTTYVPSRRVRQDPVVEEATAEPGEKRRHVWPSSSKNKPSSGTSTDDKALPVARKEQASPESNKEQAPPVTQKERGADGSK